MSAPVPDARTRFHRIVAEIASAAEGDALGALALGVLSRQAEGRTLFAGPELVEGMAAQHGIDAERAQLASANVLSVLSRGPATETEHLLVAGLAVRGLAASELDGQARIAQLERFARHALWLESCTPYEVFPFADLLLTEEDAAVAYEALSAAVVDEDHATVPARARNAARITVLARSARAAATAELERLKHAVGDPASRALLQALAGGVVEANEATAPIVRGRLDRPPPTSGLRGMLRLASGLALLGWAARLVTASVGLRSDGEIELLPAGDLRIRRTTRMLGKVIRAREEVVPRAALERVGRHARYPALTLLVGALALAGGVVLGGLLLVDGARSGDTVLLLVGAAAVLGGGLCDLVASAIAAGRRGKVSVFVEAPRQRVCVSGVADGEAERLLSAIDSAAP